MLIHNKRGGSGSTGSGGTIVNYNAIVVGTVTNTATTYSMTNYIEDPTVVSYSDFMIVLNTGSLSARADTKSIYPVIAYNGNTNAVTAYINGDSSATFTGYLYYIKKNTISASGTLVTYQAKTDMYGTATEGSLWSGSGSTMNLQTWDTGYTIDATNLNYLTVALNSAGSTYGWGGARAHAWVKTASGTVLGSTCTDTILTYSGRQVDWNNEFGTTRALTSTNCGTNIYLGNNTTSNSCTIDLTSTTGLIAVYFEGQYCSHTSDWNFYRGKNYITITGVQNS